MKAAMPEEIAKNKAQEHEDSHEASVETSVEGGDGGGHGDHHLTGLEKVEKYRKMLSESGKESITIYMVKASSVQEKTAETE